MSEILTQYNELSKRVDEVIKRQPKLEAERDLAKREAEKILQELKARGYEFTTREDIAKIKGELENRASLQMESLKRKLDNYDEFTKKAATIRQQMPDID